jgi:hypothetical protein
MAPANHRFRMGSNCTSTVGEIREETWIRVGAGLPEWREKNRTPEPHSFRGVNLSSCKMIIGGPSLRVAL